MSTPTVPDEQQPELPCHVSDPDLWFADSPSDLERAKALCADCPIRRACLAEALDRAEPWGVWGGEIFDRGSVVSRKRPRGRPRKGRRVTSRKPVRLPGFQTAAESGSANPGTSSSESLGSARAHPADTGSPSTVASTRIGIASLGGRSICRAVLICATPWFS